MKTKKPKVLSFGFFVFTRLGWEYIPKLYLFYDFFHSFHRFIEFIQIFF